MDKNIPYIFIDLDETIVNTVCHYTNNKKRVNFELDGGYSVMLRPLMIDFINKCRNLTLTKILTASVEDYAFKINELLNLGFNESDILTRYDYLDFVPSTYGAYSTQVEIAVVNESLNLSNAILIDNMYPDDVGAIHKMKFLGINEDRYIQIREFEGRDPICFENELNGIYNKIKELINNSTNII